MRTVAICLFLNLFVCGLCLSQDSVQVNTSLQKKLSAIMMPAKPVLMPSFFMRANFAAAPSANIKTLPAKFYYNSIGFFCKKEIEVEKSLKIPFKVRLGSVSYTDKMEGKNQ